MSLHQQLLERIKKEKSAQNLTDYKLAQRSNLTQKTIAAVLRGDDTRISTLQAICDCLGLRFKVVL